MVSLFCPFLLLTLFHVVIFKCFCVLITDTKKDTLMRQITNKCACLVRTNVILIGKRIWFFKKGILQKEFLYKKFFLVVHLGFQFIHM